LFDPNTFDELLFAAEMDFEGITNRHRRFGEDGLRQLLALYQTYYTSCQPYTS